MQGERASWEAERAVDPRAEGTEAGEKEDKRVLEA